ncbi:MAG: hypothetical protein KJP02_01835, partial [Octadecabacter sp.]|nr:hypothetical protein [Octadecabacter sp.]
MGALRFILASTVVLGHLFNVPHIGHMSVFFFFVLSGYLMTFVMQRSYGYSISGWKAFWVNRILRLYPTYLIVVALSVVVLSVIPKDVSSVFRGPLFLPETAWD